MLSIFNIILGFIVNLQFVFGLGVTQIIQGIAVETGTEILGIITAVLISGFYIWTYYLAAKKERLWAYFAGWSIYLLDALIYLLILPINFDASIIWPLFLHAILLVVLYSSTPLFDENTWQNIKTFDWTHSRIAYVIYGGMITLIQIGCLVLIGITKLLQKSEMRKNMVMDLIYRGFIYAANYSESHYNPRRSQIKTELRYLFVTTLNR